MKKVISFTKKDDFLFRFSFRCWGGIWGCMGLYRAVWGCMGLYRAVWGWMGLYRAVWGCIGLYGDSD